ncbi:MAG: hypothetical protein QM610_09085 [Chitinophagaceae bacterium]
MKTDNKDSIELLLKSYFSSKTNMDLENIDFRQRLAALVQHLVDKDFPALVQLLYRIDVSEKSLKAQLNNAPVAQSTAIITDAIIQRLKEKQRSQATYPYPQDIPEDERW